MLDSVFPKFANCFSSSFFFFFFLNSTRSYVIILCNLQGSALAVDLVLGGVLEVRFTTFH